LVTEASFSHVNTSSGRQETARTGALVNHMRKARQSENPSVEREEEGELGRQPASGGEEAMEGGMDGWIGCLQTI
jgi:hypothetical protein